MKERIYIKDNDYYYELSDIEIKFNEKFENVYFYKSFDNFKTFEMVFKEVNVKELKFYNEDEVPQGELPPHFDYVEPNWFQKIVNKFKNKGKK